MQATKDRLVKFWQECVERRKHQLAMHVHTFNVLQFQAGMREQTKHDQLAWIHEAERKLKHAEAVLARMELIT